ncbi:MAG: hypothetical protein QOG17_359 [Gammaproteobacteria bacterium]|jgi:acetyl esterase/lipase|nr:hypothetical protein [Gammaproteobacteria bacterium]
MTSRHLIDPQLTAWLAAMPAETLTRETLAARRTFIAEIARTKSPPLPDTVTMQEVFLPGPPGAPDVRALVFRRRESGPRSPAILHIHGGGFVAGQPEMSRATTAGYADALGAVVVSVDYRLAPETPFPGALEDCYVALAWMHEAAASIGVDPSRIAVSGESAGGGLAAALALIARDRGRYAIAFQHLTYPMLDDRTAARTDISPFIGEFVWTNACNHFGWSSLLGARPGSDGVSQYAAAARATDLSGLPPAVVLCGALDLFLEESIDYARRLILAGVPCELHVYAGAPHGFPAAWRAEVSKTFERDSREALRRALGA